MRKERSGHVIQKNCLFDSEDFKFISKKICTKVKSQRMQCNNYLLAIEASLKWGRWQESLDNNSNKTWVLLEICRIYNENKSEEIPNKFSTKILEKYASYKFENYQKAKQRPLTSFVISLKRKEWNLYIKRRADKGKHLCREMWSIV